MEQEGDHGRGGEDRRRMKEIMQQGGGGTDDGQVQPQQPEKCPRCDSLNTKFCYYNNYSLAQPRHYCKTCKRYWTIGGTLRNVPVGGGSRKGNKRPKNASSSTNNSLASRQQQQPQPPPPQEVVVQTQQPNLTTSSLVAPSMISPFYQGGGGGGGGGYLSSFAAIHSVNQSLSHPFDQPLNAVASSNLGLVSAGFNNVASLAPQRQIGPSQFYQMGSGEREVESLYMPEQGLIIPSSMANSNSRAASQSDWTQSFNNNAYNNNNRTSSDASLWSTMISTTSMSGNSTERNATAAAASSSSLFPNQWPDLPGFGSPP